MSPDDQNLDAELRRLARSRPRSGRGAQAKASALRTVERLERERRLNRERQEVPPMPEGWYPHEPGDPFYEVDLHIREDPRVLQRYWDLYWREGWV